MIDDNFLEEMMKLGIGMSVIRQMPNMMESCMPQLSKPQTATPPPLQKTESVTYIAVNGRQVGPLNDSELKTLIANGILTDNTLVWAPQLTQWTLAKCVPSIQKLMLLSSATTGSVAPAVPDINPQTKEAVVNALAALGYKDAATRKKIDSVVAASPNISIEEAIKEVLKQL